MIKKLLFVTLIEADINEEAVDLHFTASNASWGFDNEKHYSTAIS